jgi:hypothetical protein
LPATEGTYLVTKYAALLVLVIAWVPSVTQADHGQPPRATVGVDGGRLTYSALPASGDAMRISYESMPVDPDNSQADAPKALYYRVTGVDDVGPGCEALKDGEARCPPEGISSVLVKGLPQRGNSIEVRMSDRTTHAVAPAPVSITASSFPDDHIHAKDGVRETIACNAIGGDHGTILDADEAPSGCPMLGSFGASTWGNGLFMGLGGVVQVGLWCRHNYGSTPCAGVLTLDVKGAGKPSSGRYRIRNGARGFNGRVTLSRAAQRVVQKSKGPVAVKVSTAAGSGANRVQSHPGCAWLRTRGTQEVRRDPCAGFR